MHSAGDMRCTVLGEGLLPVLTCSLVYACVCVRLSFLNSVFLCSEHTKDTQRTHKGHTRDTPGTAARPFLKTINVLLSLCPSGFRDNLTNSVRFFLRFLFI